MIEPKDILTPGIIAALTAAGLAVLITLTLAAYGAAHLIQRITP